jgi:hypothetical protein
MKITLSESKDGVVRVFCNRRFSGIVKNRGGQMLCYSKGRHTTTQNITEVIRFFNGDYGSYYYRGNVR